MAMCLLDPRLRIISLLRVLSSTSELLVESAFNSRKSQGEKVISSTQFQLSEVSGLEMAGCE